MDCGSAGRDREVIRAGDKISCLNLPFCFLTLPSTSFLLYFPDGF